MVKEKKRDKKEKVVKEKEVKEKVCEVFDVQKKGEEEKSVISCGVEKEKPATEEQIKNESKIFRNVMIVLAGLLVMFFAVLFIMNSVNNFDYRGVKFEMVKEGQLTFYKTSIPVTYQGEDADYNFYLRNHPGKLEKKVPIFGNISFRKNMILDVTTENLFCDGDWNLALENIRNLYGILDVKLIPKNDSVVYINQNDYMFITFNEANSTNITKIGENDYEINVHNCEILPAAERLMVETFVQNKNLN